MNEWNKIREHYRSLESQILSEDANEWGACAYAWDKGIIHMTPIEWAIWECIRDENAVFYPQYPVLGFFVDFANPRAKVAIECDGKQWHLDKEKDQARDLRLSRAGWSVYRITGRDCLDESDPETYAPGKAQRFVRSICERHGTSRNSRKSIGPVSIGSLAIKRLYDI